MKIATFVAVLVVSLSGCVGYDFSKNGEVVDSATDFSRVSNFQDREKPPNRAPDKQYPDGTEMYVLDHERKWCGLTVFAIIPIPLWLPLCQVHTEMHYKEGKPVKMLSQWPKSSGAVCGPLVPLLAIGGGGRAGGFCVVTN